MPRQTQQWIRTSRRTPGIFIFGMVLAPCGLLLDLIATVAPNWRTLNSIPGIPTDTYYEQGIWDICMASNSADSIKCNQPDTTYFLNQILAISKGMMVASLVVNVIGLAVAIPGVRCWKDHPKWILAGLGGLIIFLSGVLAIIPISWYTHIFQNISSVTTSADIRVGYCLVLGFIGSIFEILGGIVMMVGMCRCCGGRNRGETQVLETTAHFRHTRPPPRRVEVPSISRTRSSASSVPYSQESLAEVDFPRARETSYAGRKPAYDADL